MLKSNVEPVIVTTTKSQHKVAMLPYFPYGADQAAQAIIMRETKVDIKQSVANKEKYDAALKAGIDPSEFAGDVLKGGDEIPATVYQEIVKAKLKYMVVSIDEQKYADKDEMITDLYSMPKPDVEEVIAKLSEIEKEGKISDPKGSTSQDS